MTPSIDPIAPWPLIALASLAIVGLTLWAYRKKLQGTTGRWRWVALGLRMAAVLLCILAALRPSMLVLEKQQQLATVLFLVDTSSSMGLGGEIADQTRLQAAQRALAEGVKAVKDLGEDTVPKVLAFDADAREVKPDEPLLAKGRVTAIGTALEEGVERNESTRILRVVVFSDGGSNTGTDPRAIAQSLGSRQVKIDTVGFGSESAGAGTKDVAIRDLDAGDAVFAKTELEVKTRIDVRGYPGEDLELELYAEGKVDPVAKVKVKVPPGYTEIVPRGLKWTPEDPGETRLTLKVKPKRDELIPEANNVTSTYVTVLKGGIGVFYIAGISSPWERKYLAESLDASEKIQLDWRALNAPGDPKVTEALQGRRYDVFILGDLPADFLTAEQRRLLADAVRTRGAGLIMLGGRNSFGAGGWAGTEVADVLPVELHPGDGQIEPESGLKVIPNLKANYNYVLKIAPTMPEALKLWDLLPKIGGTNRLTVKPSADTWAYSESGEPLMAGVDTGRGRAMAFGGETWPWFRAGILSPEFQRAHLNFWRNTILWLAHKEDEGDTQVRLKLDSRRVAVGQKLDLEAIAQDAQGEPIPGVEFQATVTRDAPGAKPEPLEKLIGAGDTRRGSYFATGEPGEYKVEVKATKGGEAVGTANARFLVFDDDRELRNPAADLSLLRSIASESGGAYLPPEKLADHLKSLGSEVAPDYVTQSEVRLWDNWPFLLIFALILTLEWWLRKRHGWV